MVVGGVVMRPFGEGKVALFNSSRLSNSLLRGTGWHGKTLKQAKRMDSGAYSKRNHCVWLY